MEFEIWHYWIIASIAFLLLEIFIPSFVMASVGCGCFLAFLGALLHAPIVVQLVLLIAGILIGFLGIKPLMVNYAWKTEKEVRTNVFGMIGRHGKICDAIESNKEYGHVIIDGDTWQAISEDGNDIPRNAKVEVTHIDSIILTVKVLEMPPPKEYISETPENIDVDTSSDDEVPVETEVKTDKSLLVSIGQKHQLFHHDEVLCFYSNQKISYLLPHSGNPIIIDDSLERLYRKLPTDHFFRANRQFIITTECVRQISSAENGKLSIHLCENRHIPDQITVSRLKSHAFRKWLKQHCESV
jgi:membrane protein implicated in regulation of membrane protease activity